MFKLDFFKRLVRGGKDAPSPTPAQPAPEDSQAKQEDIARLFSAAAVLPLFEQMMSGPAHPEENAARLQHAHGILEEILDRMSRSVAVGREHRRELYTMYMEALPK